MARITTARRLVITAESVQQALQLLAGYAGVLTAGTVQIVIRPAMAMRPARKTGRRPVPRVSRDSRGRL